MGIARDNIVFPASILAGTIIGAGIFSLPFVFNAAGILTGLFYLAVFGLVYILIYFFYGDLILRTPGEHRFVGYAKLYLGNSGFWAAIFIGLVQLLFVLTIYLVLAPSFSKLFISDGYLYHLLAFWLIGSIAILFDIKRIAALEFLITLGIIGIILFVFGLGFKNIFYVNWGNFDLSQVRDFALVGPVLFSLSGSLAVPEVISYFRESKTPLVYLKKSLVLGSFLPALVYAGFVIGILGLSAIPSEDAVSGLIDKVPAAVLVLMGILGFLSLISSYIVIGLNSRRIFEYDLGLPGLVSRGLVIIIPLILYFSGFQSFIGLVDFIGSVFLPLESIFIIFMWLQANKKSEMPAMLVGKPAIASIPVLLLIFVTALIYAIIK